MFKKKLNSSSSNNPLKQTLEKLDNSTGKVASQITDSLKTAAKDTATQLANTPMDILEGLIGTGGGPSSRENSTANSGDPDDPNNPNSPLYKKMQEEQKKKAELIRQHRQIIQEFKDFYEKRKQELEQQEEMEAHQEEQEKVAKKQREDQKKKIPMWRRIFQGGIGGVEQGKKTH